MLATILVAACSSNDDKLTHAEFVEQVDRLCREADEALDPFVTQSVAAFSNGDYASAANELEKALEQDARYHELIAAVDAPDEDESDFERFLEIRQDIQEKVERTVQGLREKGPEGLSEWANTESLESLHRVASRIGFHDCSEADPTG